MSVTDHRLRLPGDSLSRRHAIGWGLVALGLVTVVAMAAHGAAWSDDGKAGKVRSLPHAVTFAFGVVAFVVAVALFLLSLARAGARETAEQRRKRWLTAIFFIALLVAISLVRGFAHPSDTTNPRSGAPPASGRPRADGAARDGSSPTTWWPLVIVGVGTAAALVAATARRRAVKTTDTDSDAATIALLDASLDDLRGEPDARRAVVAAYARMEGGLAAHGFARQLSETPSEYLGRAISTASAGSVSTGASGSVSTGASGALAAHPVVIEALGELTELAERARFSTYAIDESMRARAIDALVHLRDELRPRADADIDIEKAR